MRRFQFATCLGAFLLLTQAGSAQVMVDRGALKKPKIEPRIVGPRGAAKPPPDAARIPVKRDELLVARTGDKAIRVPVQDAAKDKVKFELPIQLVGVDAEGKQLNLAAVVEVAGGGLRMQPDLMGFAGHVYVGLEDKDQPGTSRKLGYDVQILVTADADSVAPESLTLDHANLPFATVQIHATRPGDVVHLNVRPTFETDGFSLDVPVVRPGFSLRASPTSIQGFGLETAELTILADRGMTSEMSVALSADRSRPEPSHLELDRSGAATSSLRSNGLGTATVTAENSLLGTVTTSVRFVFPWAFLAAVTLGGAIGGIARYATLKSQKVKVRFTPLVIHALLGIVFGLLATTLYAIGVNVLEFHPTATIGETLTFAISAVGAIVSGKLVKRILGFAPEKA